MRMVTSLKRHALLVTVACAAIAKAQQPFPTDADNGSWNVLTCTYGIGSFCTTGTFAFSGTLNMCGHDYSVLPYSFSDTAYFRNEGTRTLFRRSIDCSEKEYLSYDYSLGIGDTVFVGQNVDYLDPDTAAFVLVSIDSVTLFGVSRMRYTMNYYPCNDGPLIVPMHWIEGLGSTTHPFYSLACMCDFCESSHQALCYDSSGVQLYQDTIVNTCDTTIIGIDESFVAVNAGISITPNPVSGSALVRISTIGQRSSSERSELLIVSSDGRWVGRQPLPHPCPKEVVIDVSALPAGLYGLYLCTGTTCLARQKFVKAP